LRYQSNRENILRKNKIKNHSKSLIRQNKLFERKRNPDAINRFLASKNLIFNLNFRNSKSLFLCNTLQPHLKITGIFRTIYLISISLIYNLIFQDSLFFKNVPTKLDGFAKYIDVLTMSSFAATQLLFQKSKYSMSYSAFLKVNIQIQIYFLRKLKFLYWFRNFILRE